MPSLCFCHAICRHYNLGRFLKPKNHKTYTSVGLTMGKNLLPNRLYHPIKCEADSGIGKLAKEMVRVQGRVASIGMPGVKNAYFLSKPHSEGVRMRTARGPYHMSNGMSVRAQSIQQLMREKKAVPTTPPPSDTYVVGERMIVDQMLANSEKVEKEKVKEGEMSKEEEGEMLLMVEEMEKKFEKKVMEKEKELSDRRREMEMGMERTKQMDRERDDAESQVLAPSDRSESGTSEEENQSTTADETQQAEDVNEEENETPAPSDSYSGDGEQGGVEPTEDSEGTKRDPNDKQ